MLDMQYALMWSTPALIALIFLALWTYLSKRTRITHENDSETTHSHTDKTPANAQTSSYGPEKPTPGSRSASLPESITNSSEDLIERGDWVQRLAEYIQREHHKSLCNIVVVNNDIQYRFNAEGIVEDYIVKYYATSSGKVVSYRVVAFEKGVLINFGDGGYVNWCGIGKMTRLGVKTMKFDVCDGENEDL